jgi:glycosyltransferase involved in cell wall biosynthesis
MMIGVVVSCYRQERWLAGTLRGLEAALAGHDWHGVLEFAAPSDAPLPPLSERWRVIHSYEPGTGAPRRLLTPGAGRMVGFDQCGGDWVLFVDSDVELDPGWIEDALALAAREPRVGGVGGRLEEWFLEPGGATRRNAPDMYAVGAADREIEYLAALALYRREALLEAGGYDVRLNSDEDFELGLRFRWAGWRLWALARRGGRHWSAPRPSFPELARRWRTGLTLGRGQVLRLYLGRRGLGRLLRHQALYVAALGMWALGVTSIVYSLVRLDWKPFAWWLALPAFVLAVMLARKRSVFLAVHSLLSWTVNGLGLVVGFAAPPSPVPLGGAVAIRGSHVEGAC